MRETIFNSSGYQQAIRIILLGVTDDTATVKVPQSCGGDKWTSVCKDHSSEAGDFLITIIKKNNEIVGKFVYNNDTQIELEYVYDRVEKVFVVVEHKEAK